MKVFEEEVLGTREKVLYDKRVRLYKVNTIDQWMDALKETKTMERIPVFIRTPKC